tara:strand:- start:185 stop:352 length:168 start_codon:yes stop_codon:yes gene_type:complete
MTGVMSTEGIITEENRILLSKMIGVNMSIRELDISVKLIDEVGKIGETRFNKKGS